MTADITMAKQVQEILDRTRRTETRLTRYLEAQGVRTGAAQATWEHGRVIVPSPGVSIRDVFKAVPRDWPLDARIEVWCGESRLMTFTL